MTSQSFDVVMTATGEVRDIHGNLIETIPITSTVRMTADEATALAGTTATTLED